MKIFLDTANLEEIKKASQTRLLAGVTTNPTLVAREGVEVGNPEVLRQFYKDVCRIVSGPVSVEVISQEAEAIVEEAKRLAKIHPEIVVKIPMTAEGLKATRALRNLDYSGWILRVPRVNITLVFSAEQALLAAKSGAKYVSIFVGRLDDAHNAEKEQKQGMEVVKEALTIFNHYGFESEIIVASVRHKTHVLQAALLGAPIVTMPPKIFWEMFEHPLTNQGIKRFLDDWEKASC